MKIALGLVVVFFALLGIVCLIIFCQRRKSHERNGREFDEDSYNNRKTNDVSPSISVTKKFEPYVEVEEDDFHAKSSVVNSKIEASNQSVTNIIEMEFARNTVLDASGDQYKSFDRSKESTMPTPLPKSNRKASQVEPLPRLNTEIKIASDVDSLDNLD